MTYMLAARRQQRRHDWECLAPSGLRTCCWKKCRVRGESNRLAPDRQAGSRTGTEAQQCSSLGATSPARIKSNPLVQKMAEEQISNVVLRRRTGKAEEIANTALFLVSDESSYITGTDIVVDGGWFSSAPYVANERSHHILSPCTRRKATTFPPVVPLTE